MMREQLAKVLYESQFVDDFDDLPPNCIDRALALQMADAAIEMFRCHPEFIEQLQTPATEGI